MPYICKSGFKENQKTIHVPLDTHIDNGFIGHD